jgi:hypothetical protein
MQSGIGFSYKKIDDKHGFQITIGAIGTSSSDDDYYFSEDHTQRFDYGWTPNVNETIIEISGDNGYFWGNMGVLYIKPLHRVEKSLFYGFTGLSANYTVDKYYERPYKYFHDSAYDYTYRAVGPEKEVKDSETRIFLGVGLGLSYNVTKHITISLELPFTISDEGNIWMIIPQGSIHYFYK